MKINPSYSNKVSQNKMKQNVPVHKATLALSTSPCFL